MADSQIVKQIKSYRNKKERNASIELCLETNYALLAWTSKMSTNWNCSEGTQKGKNILIYTQTHSKKASTL